MKIINEIRKSDLEVMQQIDKNCLALHLAPPPKTFIKIEVIDENGVPQLDYNLKSNSWVRNAYNLNFMRLTGSADASLASGYGEGYLKGKETGGVALGDVMAYITFQAAAGSTNSGILVGSSDSAETLESYDLASKILNGTGSGQLSYQAQETPVFSYDSGTKKWTARQKRYFNNNSGAGITVKEIGLVGHRSSYENSRFLLSRDVLGSPVTVPNGGQLSVTYVIEQVFPG